MAVPLCWLTSPSPHTCPWRQGWTNTRLATPRLQTECQPESPVQFRRGRNGSRCQEPQEANWPCTPSAEGGKAPVLAPHCLCNGLSHTLQVCGPEDLTPHTLTALKHQYISEKGNVPRKIKERDFFLFKTAELSLLVLNLIVTSWGDELPTAAQFKVSSPHASAASAWLCLGG